MVRRTSGFQRGDIVRVSLNPTQGRELQGELRPALVISEHAFNELTGTPLIVPITQGGNLARVAGFAVTLMGCGTEHKVSSSHMRFVPWICKLVAHKKLRYCPIV